MKRAVWQLAILAALNPIASCGERIQPLYELSRLDVPGSASTIAAGINDAGHIVGWYRDTAGDRVRGFLLRDGVFTPVDYPDAILTQLHGIGPEGDVVGTYRKAGDAGGLHGFLRTRTGAFSDVNVAGHPNSIAQRILPDGTILGCYHGGDWTNSMRGVSFTPRGPSVLDLPGSMSNGATPDGRRVVGLVMDGTREVVTTGKSVGPAAANWRRFPGRAFVVDDGVLSVFEVPGSLRTEAWDVNPSGTIVGMFQDSSSAAHGFVREGEAFTTIDFPGTASTMVFGINAAGDLVGHATDSTGWTHAFVAKRRKP